MDKVRSLLGRGVQEIVVKKDLEKALRSGRKLRVKLGLDPNIADLHLGHGVVLRKLRAFQDLGHRAVLILGDYTALIGDPSGKDKTRQILDQRAVRKNAVHFLDQVYKILDRKKTEHHFQTEWFGQFDLKKTLELLSKMTVEQIMSHETFASRLKKGQPFFMHELIYPLMQGYDSVAVRADVELGALEQKFNLLVGRRLQRAWGQKEQNVMMLDYLIGLDGKEKMSKSLDNFVSLREAAPEMYGKIMSISDKLIGQYYELCTDLPAPRAGSPKVNKEKLAYEIVRIYHGEELAHEAADQFRQVFSRGQLPDKIPQLKVNVRQITLIGALLKTGLAKSRSEARRLIEQGGIKLDQKTVKDENLIIQLDREKILQKGKRYFFRLKK